MMIDYWVYLASNPYSPYLTGKRYAELAQAAPKAIVFASTRVDGDDDLTASLRGPQPLEEAG